MAKIELQLPTIQNWSCQSCGICCRQHQIAITPEERERILGQNWTADDGLADPERLVEPHPQGTKERPFRLAHQPDGSCVFLDERGLCRIHAKFGEPAKPLACRIYPYAFHPAGKQIAVGLRFSCPSVVANAGAPVDSQHRDLQELSKQVVPAGYRQAAPPKISPRESVDWSGVNQVVRHLDETFADESASFPVKLLRALGWVDLLSQASLAKINGSRLNELVTLLRQSAAVEHERLPETIERPSRIGRVMFRLLLSIYARRETQEELDSPLKSRWLSLRSTVRFAWGGGRTPRLHETLPAVRFRDIEAPTWNLPAGSDALFTRYFRLKIQGMHFCGGPYYDFPLTTGFFSLALMFPVIVWLARWIASGLSRRALEFQDVADAMAVADHHHGYSPVLGLAPFRKRVEYLHRLGDLPRLIVRYAGGDAAPTPGPEGFR